MLFVLQQFHEFLKIKKISFDLTEFSNLKHSTQFCAIFNLNFHLQFVLTATDFLSFDRTRVCRIYFTTYVSQDRMFCFLFLQNFLRILLEFWDLDFDFEFAQQSAWLCGAAALRAQFELWRDLSWFIRNDVYPKH